MKAKSDNVQFRYREMCVDTDLLGNFCESDGLYSVDYAHDDELVDLVEELAVHIKEIVMHKLTTRQTQIVQLLYYEGLTQMEAAHRLGLCQPTIHKGISGNLDYSHGGRRYGGAIKKMQKICEEDERIQFILKRIAEIKSGAKGV